MLEPPPAVELTYVGVKVEEVAGLAEAVPAVLDAAPEELTQVVADELEYETTEEAETGPEVLDTLPTVILTRVVVR